MQDTVWHRTKSRHLTDEVSYTLAIKISLKICRTVIRILLMLVSVNWPLEMTSALALNWPAFGASGLEPPAVGRYRVGLSGLV